MCIVQGKFNNKGKKNKGQMDLRSFTGGFKPICDYIFPFYNFYLRGRIRHLETQHFIYDYVSLESKLYSTLFNLLLGRLHFHPPFYHHMVMDPSSTVGHFPEFLGPHQWPHSFSLAKV